MLMGMIGDSVKAILQIASTIAVSTLRLSSTTATLQLDADGDIMKSNAQGTAVTVDIGDWIAPVSAAGGNYECRATILSGTLSGGTTGTWQALSSDRFWFVTQSVIGTKVCSFTLEIREVANPSNIVSSTVTLTADMTS